MNFTFNPRSTNRKVGPIPVVTASRDTCPSTCSLKSNGCYAESGPLAIHWRRVSDGTAKNLLNFSELISKIKEMVPNQLWRYAQAGDLPDSREDVLTLAEANAGRPAIVYTHKRDTDTYLEAKKMGLNINMSADTMEEADAFADIGLPSVVVLHSDLNRRNGESISDYRTRLGGSLKATQTPKGRSVAICPATYMDDVTCSSCKACSHDRGGQIIGFPAHGTSKGRINKRLAVA